MAKKSSIRLTIPAPCSENWERMTPEGRGRFCSSCSKTVVDFTGMSDRELLRFFKTAGAHTCGRLSPGQVNREIFEPGSGKPGWQRWLLGGFMALLAAVETKGETVERHAISVEQFPLVKDGDIVANVAHEDTTRRYVEGYVYDARTKEPLPLCLVFYSQNAYCMTDSLGHFRFQIPDSLVGRNFILVIRSIGYQSHSCQINPERSRASLNIGLNATNWCFTTGRIVVKEPAYKRAWYRLRGYIGRLVH